MSGNPRGRPPGSRSRSSLLREARLAERLDRELDGMMDALVAKALSGHVGAIRTVLALSLPKQRLDLQLSADDGDAPPEDAAGEPAAAPAMANLRNPVLSAEIQRPELSGGTADGPAPRTFTVDAPADTETAALQAFLAKLGVRPGDQDRITCHGTARLAGLVAIEPLPDLVREARLYLVAAPAGTPPDALVAFLRSLGIEPGPDDRVTRAGHAPQPMLILATPPLRIAAADGGSPP